MAWIESHQALRGHPKVTRLARLLDVHWTSAVGMMHSLWWWALDHAEDGDVSDFDAHDLAEAMGWEGDPEQAMKALRECGPGSRAGFLEDAGGRWVLHDWQEYAGRLVARRAADRDRKRRVRETSDGRPPEVPRNSGATNQPNQPTSSSDRRADVDHLCDLLADLVVTNGSRRPDIGKGWRDAARLLIDRDGVEPAEAERVMRWALADEFWRTNVLSMPTFRKQYDRLRLKSSARPSRPPGVTAAGER